MQKDDLNRVEKMGRHIGFGTALILFAFIFHSILSKINLIPSYIPSQILIFAFLIVYIIYLIIKVQPWKR